MNKKIALRLAIVVCAFALLALLIFRPFQTTVPYSPIDGLSMARSYFKAFEDIGFANEYSKELIRHGTPPMDFFRTKANHEDIKAVILYVSYQPATPISAVKDIKIGLPVQESKLSIDTFVVTHRQVECFADLIRHTKPLHTHFVFGDGHLDHGPPIDIQKGLRNLENLPPNDHVQPLKFAMIVQTEEGIRMYSMDNKSTASEGFHILIPFVPF